MTRHCLRCGAETDSAYCDQCRQEMSAKAREHQAREQRQWQEFRADARDQGARLAGERDEQAVVEPRQREHQRAVEEQQSQTEPYAMRPGSKEHRVGMFIFFLLLGFVLLGIVVLSLAKGCGPGPIDPRLTVDYIDRFQSPIKGAGHYTDVQRKANWQRMFAGRRVRWTGVVQDVTEDFGAYTISLRCGSTALGTDTRCTVSRDTALRIRKGTSITVEGTLSDHGAFGYRLTNVQIK